MRATAQHKQATGLRETTRQSPTGAAAKGCRDRGEERAAVDRKEVPPPCARDSPESSAPQQRSPQLTFL